jgi:hypothetical protein
MVNEQTSLSPAPQSIAECTARMRRRVVQDYDRWTLDLRAVVVQNLDNRFAVDKTLMQLGIRRAVLVLQSERLNRTAMSACDRKLKAFTHRLPTVRHDTLQRLLRQVLPKKHFVSPAIPSTTLRMS